MPAWGAEQWLKISTPNFELYTTAGEKRGIETVQHFEQIRGFFRKASQGAKSRTERKVRLVAFRGEKEYKPYRPNEVAVAYYMNRGDQDLIVMREAGPDVYRIAVHEYVHLLLRQPGVDIPYWLNEGLAELYSTLKREGSRTQVGSVIESHYIQLRQVRWMDVPSLTRVDLQSPYYNEKERAGIFYAESWALAHMLKFREGYHEKFDDFMSRVVKGTSSEDAFRQSYGKSAAEVEKDLKDYMQGTRFRAALMDVALEKSAEKPVVEPAPEVELGLTLAEVTGGGRSAEGKAALERLAAAHPKDPELAEALAYEAWRGGQREDALKQFERAVELRSGNAKLHYLCAALSHEQGRPLARVVELLAKATTLDPEYRDAWLRLGYTRFAEQRYVDAALAWNHINRVTPDEAPQFFRALAYTHYRIGKKEEARRGAERALRQAKTVEDVKQAQELLRFVEEQPLSGGFSVDPAPALQRQPDEAATEGTTARVAQSRSAPRYSASGTFTELECGSAGARLHLAAEGKKLVFLLDRPNMVAIRGVDAAVFEFTCGPQKPGAITVEYEVREGMQAGVTGLVRALEMK